MPCYCQDAIARKMVLYHHDESRVKISRDDMIKTADNSKTVVSPPQRVWIDPYCAT
jgi:hypothetical protein